MGGNSTAFWVDFRGFLHRESRHHGNGWVIITPLSRELSNTWKSARKFKILWAVFSRIHVDCVREKAAVGARGCDRGKQLDAGREVSAIVSVETKLRRTVRRSMTSVLKYDHYKFTTTSFIRLERLSADLHMQLISSHFVIYPCSIQYNVQIPWPFISGKSVKVLPESGLSSGVIICSLAHDQHFMKTI